MRASVPEEIDNDHGNIADLNPFAQ